MADVDDRGQLLIVGALTFAVMLVALAVLLNAAIYTGTVATRDAGTGTGEAIEFQGEATTMASDTITALNERDDLNESQIRTALADSVETWSRAAAVHASAALAGTEVETVDIRTGTRIQQNTIRNFTDNDGAQGWTVANESTARAFRLDVQRDSLETLDDSTDYASSSSFRLVFNDSGGNQLVQIYTRNGSDNVSVGVDGDTADATGECTTVSGDAEVPIDITGGTVGSVDCPELDALFAGLSEPYTVRIENGHYANGTYAVDVRQSVDEVAVSTDQSDDPYATAILYDAELRITYRSEGVFYRSEFTVSPEVSDD